eukprot:CAMPEP_0172320740 /NCGR_PEP_ID=MMETSP1058-20130122/41285_1 /TAXON_ID=83371 /ORGANISM="Detonula confervacea, Strain CCMP 353" /LENGTH=779 /DNA_ID=CAMNT_0013036067 /DNA_START=84 /DNA_END=2423 /DNA_ORIENTATION=+
MGGGNNHTCGIEDFVKRSEIIDCIVDGTLIIEVKMKLTEMTDTPEPSCIHETPPCQSILRQKEPPSSSVQTGTAMPMSCSREDAAVSLIQRLVDASTSTTCDDEAATNINIDTATIINEMRDFLRLESDTDRNNISIGWGECEQEQTIQIEVLESSDNDHHSFDVDLSSHEYTIGDAGCTHLMHSICDIHTRHNNNYTMCTLDLEANGLSAVGASALAAGLRSFPQLQHLNLGCNGIGADGCRQIALQLCHVPLLESLDFHGNSIGDGGCTALTEFFHAMPLLEVLDLSANRIEDGGAKALNVLFRGGCCPCLTSLNLRENGIESIAGLVSRPSPILELQVLDLSWNSILNFDALDYERANFSNLTELEIKGNALSDQECRILCAKLLDDEILDCKDDCAVIPPSEGRMRVCLRQLADGGATNASICQLSLWQNTRSRINHNEEKKQEEELVASSDDPLDAFSLLRRDGFVVHPPTSQDMNHLSNTMDLIEGSGYPPVFCFMNDVFWEFVTAQVWPMVSSLLGVDDSLCLLDAGSAFAWSLKATGKSTFPRDGEFRKWQNACTSINTTTPKEKEKNEEGHRGLGSSFGLPHRDYSAANSLYCEEHPAVLTVWIPLNDATTENGCMYVVPKEFDADFSRRDDHHAHMNPATEVQRGSSSKIHFPLHGARALPAPAGSLIAWYGNAIHWGSSCSKYANDPRKSIALTFVRGDCDALSTTTGDDVGPRIHNPSPPISISQAAAMTPEMRLSFISRSLLLYNQWHALADDAIPALIYETTAVP